MADTLPPWVPTGSHRPTGPPPVGRPRPDGGMHGGMHGAGHGQPCPPSAGGPAGQAGPGAGRAVLPDPAPGPVGADLPGFEPGRLLGRGAHGVVIAARQRSLDREVALKRLPGADAEAARRLRVEAGVLAGLDHPHIVRILDVVPDGTGVALVLPLAAGRSLADLLDHRGPLAASEVAALGTRLAGALASAHRRGLLHLDVKPSNVLLTADGEPMLADFGVAKAIGGVRGRSATGTPGFLAPEAVLGQAGPPSDVWSLGVLLRRALDPERSHPELESTIAEATRVDPGERIGAEALAAALASRAGPCPRPAPPESPATRCGFEELLAGDPAAGGVGGGRRRRARDRARQPVLVATVMVALVACALWVVRSPGTDPEVAGGHPVPAVPPAAPPVPAPPLCTDPAPVPAGARLVAADLGAGCTAEVLWWPDRGEARLPVAALPDDGAAADRARGNDRGEVRYLLGAPGDQLLLGDWTCDGAATPALHRPATGELFTFDRWADEGAALPSREAVGLTGPGGRAEVVAGPDGCDTVRLAPPDA